MQIQCKYCKKLIYFLQMNNGSWKAFEDETATIVHKCPEYEKNKSKTQSNDRILLTETITRVSQVEYKIDQIKKILDKNGLYFQWR